MPVTPRPATPHRFPLLALLVLGAVAALLPHATHPAIADDTPASPAPEEPTSEEPTPEDATEDDRARTRAARPRTQSALGFEASASFKDFGRVGQFLFRFDAEADSRGEDANQLVEGNLLLVHPGGWLIPLDPDTVDGSFFRGAFDIPANAVTRIAGQEYAASTPASHALLSLYARDGHAQVVTPIVRLGYTRPAAWRPSWPYGIGVVGPLEAVRFSDGTSSIMLVGQHQVLDGSTPTEVQTSLELGSDRGAGEPVRWQGLDARGDRTALWPFVRRVDVDEQFEKGWLRVESTAALDGTEARFSRSFPVTRVKAAPLRGPVLGTWQLSNGPGQRDLHANYMKPQHRYAYDFVVLEGGRTHKGDPHKNESYFAWNRSVRAAADGVIVALCDAERDNPGYRGAAANCYTNHIIIRHDDGLHTAYLHLRRRSIPKGLLKDTPVKAGQVIGRVGNSGESSEPHLHFMAFRIDETGRWVAAPVSFTNASHDAKARRPVQGVPIGGSILHFRDRR